ncbi:MAG: 16S rRNA (adenine(1518)-N(6)/adenine(1519)-N(6))-dimethyltransferase RsmA [Bacilli bacterium]|nr:16S rRNA (adenine(1518)-N(6)/adenine(1519)-N(6))-dimethyltransferase RsmA [Bacilli bacterium]
MREEEYFEHIQEYGMLAKKEVGQNFLINLDACKRIVGALEAEEGDKVLEIGVGAGSLTYFLSLLPNDIEGIDIDEAMVTKLQNDFKENANVNVHMGNAMRYEYKGYQRIIGNLPYYVTSGILEKVLLGANDCKKAVFMVQQEAANRFLSKPGSKDYGPLPILMALSGKAKKLFNVGRNSFIPIPNVDSSVFQIEFDDNRGDLSFLYYLCNQLFLNRRKTIFNNLKNVTKNAEFAQNLLENAGILPTLRPEQINPQTYLLLSKNQKLVQLRK